MKLLPALLQLVRRILRREPTEPQDPYARVLVPVLRGPAGRSSAIALEEPIEPIQTDARSRH